MKSFAAPAAVNTRRLEYIKCVVIVNLFWQPSWKRDPLLPLVCTNELVLINVFSLSIIKPKPYLPACPLRDMRARGIFGNDSPNLLGFFECCSVDDNVHIVGKYFENGSLSEHLSLYGNMTESAAKDMLVQLLEGISYLQNLGISIRLISASNIFVSSDTANSNPYYQFGNFEAAVRSPLRDDILNADDTPFTASSFKSIRGKVSSESREYLAPEMFGDNPFINPMFSDIYSLAVVLFYSVKGRFPIPFTPITLQNDTITLRGIDPWREIAWVQDGEEPFTPLFENLLKGMLEEVPEKRFTVSQILAHPWLSQV